MKFAKWQELKDKTAALSLRERVILLSAAMICVGFIWAQFYFLGFEKKLKRVNHETQQQQLESADKAEQLSVVLTKLADDPNALLRDEHQQLQGKLDELKADIEQRLSNLIEPELMADVMKSVLSDYKGLRLLNAKNLPVVPLKIESNNIAKNKKDQVEEQAVLFSHGFQMELEGDYFQALSFMQKLEQMKGFYWTQFNYEVKTYPKARIIIQLSTLSLEEGWIGV